MKSMRILAIAIGLIAQSTMARAGEEVLTATVPGWVIPAPAIVAGQLPEGDGALAILDEQSKIEGDTTTTYIDAAKIIASASDLQKSGTLTLNWQPDHGDLTIYRIEIMRDGQVIDLLKDGPQFTVLRREAQLQNQVVTGQLTAVRQIEGLRVGDILRFSVGISEHDPVLRGKMQTNLLLLPEPIKIGFGRARLIWPANQPIRWKSMIEGIEVTPTELPGDLLEISIPMPTAKLPEMPDWAPGRFKPLPLLYATDFSDWSEVAAVIAPHYNPIGTIPDGSDLAEKVDRIAATQESPIERMAAALRLVQDDVRYLAITMGTGNYVPQAPIETWDKRYGDCKAKTLLLLAILQRLGITAEAVLASSGQGDRLPAILPAPLDFDHVFVRAEVDGESFWLDGTNLGSRMADIRDVPRFGYVLPLRLSGADLIQLPVRANARPSPDIALVYDGTGGVRLPMPFEFDVTYAGAAAETTHADILAGGDKKLEELGRSLAKQWTGSEDILRPHSDYDANAATLSLHIEGLAYPDWDYRDGRLQLEPAGTMRVVFDPQRGKSAWKSLPALIDRPWTAKQRITFRLPPEAADAELQNDARIVLESPAVSYLRSVEHNGSVIVEAISSAESGAEIPSSEIASLSRLVADAHDQSIRISMPDTYPSALEDITRMSGSPALAKIRKLYDARIAEDPEDGWRLFDRGWIEEQMYNWADAEKFYSAAIEKDPISAFYVSRSQVRDTVGNYAGALADAQTAYELDSSNNDARVQLAYTLGKTGKVEEGLELFDDTPDVQTDEGLDEVYWRVGTLWRGHRFTDAIDELDAALRRLPNSAGLLDLRCWTKAIANEDLTGALEDCDRAVAISSESADYFESRAMVRFRSAEFPEAMADLDTALRLSPDLSLSYFLRGVISELMDKGGGADLATARALFPGIDDYFAGFGIAP